MNRTNVMHEQWDYLIILDACRYDYFERMYRRCLNGKLEKKISVGSSTVEWRDLSFPDYYDDVVYISANPNISADLPVHGFCAGEHFFKVYEVWKSGWDKNRGTVLPETLTRTALDIISNNIGKRFIIHYLQPHAPYLSLGEVSRGYVDADINADRVLIDTDSAQKKSEFNNKLLKIISKPLKKTNILTNKPEWVLKKLLGLAPSAPMEAAWRSAGKKGLQEAYQANLEIVLEQVAVLIEHLSGRIIITADHGELLGEDKCYAHPPGSTNPILTEVPWLVIDKPKDTSPPQTLTVPTKDETQKPTGPKDRIDSEKEQQEISDKLKALGYYE